MKVRLLALPIVLAGALCAQGRGPGGNPLTPPTPAEALQRQVDRLTKIYSLTTTPTNQVSQVQSALSTEQSCLPTPAALETAREGLVTAIKAGASGVPPAVTALTDLQSQAEGCRAKAAASIWAILTPTQQMKGIGPLLGLGGLGPGRGPGPGGPPPGGPPPTPPAKP